MKVHKKKIDENTPCRELLEAFDQCMQDKSYIKKLFGACSDEFRALSRCSKEENELENITRKKKINRTRKLRKIKMIEQPKIEDSFKKLDNYPSVTERYFTPYFYLSQNCAINEHHCVLLHSNKISLITLAPSHPVIKEKKTIKRFDFQVTNKLDRLENKVTGKSKKGGQNIQPDSVLCFLECDDGTKYSIYGCVKGKLIEINELLTKNSNLLVEKPLSMGFIAIILPSKKEMNNVKDNLISYDDYKKLVLKK